MDPVAQAEAPATPATPAPAAEPSNAQVEASGGPAVAVGTPPAAVPVPAPAAPAPAPVAASTSPALSIGRSVHYCRHNGEHAPAIVTRVQNETCGNLTVFTDTDGVHRQTCVCQGEPHHVGTWHWPERV